MIKVEYVLDLPDGMNRRSGSFGRGRKYQEYYSAISQLKTNGSWAKFTCPNKREALSVASCIQSKDMYKELGMKENERLTTRTAPVNGAVDGQYFLAVRRITI